MFEVLYVMSSVVLGSWISGGSHQPTGKNDSKTNEIILPLSRHYLLIFMSTFSFPSVAPSTNPSHKHIVKMCFG